MTQPHVVYLIGFMGCGKTTVGKKLAASLKWKFIDLDKKIEEKTGLTIDELFSTHGEKYFREIEAVTLRELTFDSNCIVAVGGGTPCFKENMNFMLNTGYTIYLKLTPAQLASRLKVSADERPLIRNIQEENLPHFIETKLSERSTQYEKAHLIIDGFNVDMSLISKQIQNHFGC
jgi:shikimate kinase